MFTGIIENTANLINIKEKDNNLDFYFKSNLINELKIDQSVSHNGVCLTVVDSKDSSFSVAVIPYTWENTNLKDVKVGGRVNLEFDILGKYISKLISKA